LYTLRFYFGRNFQQKLVAANLRQFRGASITVTPKEKFIALGIPKQAVASLAHVSPSELSLWMRDPSLLHRDKVTALDRACADACKLAEATRAEFPRGICVDWKDSVGVRELFTKLFVHGAENVVPTTST
jgi:hypothetical protein